MTERIVVSNAPKHIVRIYVESYRKLGTVRVEKVRQTAGGRPHFNVYHTPHAPHHTHGAPR